MYWLTRRAGLPPAALWLLAGVLVTTMGNGVQAFAVGKLLFDRTGSVAAFGGVIILEQAATVVTQFVAGPWVDRGNPGRTLIQVELVRGGAIIVAAALVGSEQLLIGILLMTLVIRVAQPFYRTATFSLTPAVVPAGSFNHFNGWSNVCLQTGQLMGVALAGVLLQQSGASAAFIFNGLTFLFSAMTVWLAAVPRSPAAPVSPAAARGQLVRSWHEIAVLVRRTRGLGGHVTLATADSVAVNLFNLLLVAIIAERFDSSAYWLSVVGCAFAIGAIATGPVVSSLVTHCGSRVSVTVALGAQAACFALLGLTQPGWVTVVLSFGLGAFNTISWTVLTTTLQLSLGGPVRGRVAAARSLLTAVFTVALVPLVSHAETVSLAWALGLAGAVCLAFALIALIFGLCQASAVGLSGLAQPAPAPGV